MFGPLLAFRELVNLCLSFLFLHLLRYQATFQWKCVSSALKMTQVVRLMLTKCRAAELFLSQFVHGMSRCGWPLLFGPHLAEDKGFTE